MRYIPLLFLLLIGCQKEDDNVLAEEVYGEVKFGVNRSRTNTSKVSTSDWDHIFDGENTVTISNSEGVVQTMLYTAGNIESVGSVTLPPGEYTVSIDHPVQELIRSGCCAIFDLGGPGLRYYGEKQFKVFGGTSNVQIDIDTNDALVSVESKLSDRYTIERVQVRPVHRNPAAVSITYERIVELIWNEERGVFYSYMNTDWKRTIDTWSGSHPINAIQLWFKIYDKQTGKYKSVFMHMGRHPEKKEHHHVQVVDTNSNFELNNGSYTGKNKPQFNLINLTITK